MRIGPYLLDNNLLLAPMAGVTDKPDQIPIIREIFAVAEENKLPEAIKAGETS